MKTLGALPGWSALKQQILWDAIISQLKEDASRISEGGCPPLALWSGVSGARLVLLLSLIGAFPVPQRLLFGVLVCAFWGLAPRGT